MRQVLAFVLTVYAGVSLSIGFLHNDDAIASGSGQITFGAYTPSASGSFHLNGPCLACLFTAGHIVERQLALPRLSITDHLESTTPSTQPTGFSVRHSARAPPDIHSYLINRLT